MDPSPSNEGWNSYKELKTMVWKYLNQKPDSNLPFMDFENVLCKYKEDFFALLEYPPKNAKKREDLEKRMTDAVNVRGLGEQVLSTQIYEEAILLSDLFDLDEFIALDLLCNAQISSPSYPGESRGLIAILLYYEGRKSLVTTLLYLVQARNGNLWSVCDQPDITRLVTEYTDQLMDAGLFNKIFHLLRTLDFSTEIEKLQENKALGGPKHRDQVVNVFNSIRYTLADVVFSWAAQSGLPKEVTFELLCYLREIKLEQKSSGIMDEVTLLLQLSFLAALDLSLFIPKEGEKVAMTSPILSDESFIPRIAFEFLTPRHWGCAGIHALCGLGIAVCLAYIRMTPQSSTYQEFIDQEDDIVDSAIEHDVFGFIDNVLLENQRLYKEPFLYNTLHNFLTDFIIFMFPKVKELRMKSNEVSRTLLLYTREGLQPPDNLPRHFESLLLSIGKFYSKNKFGENYNLVWWNPMEIYLDRNKKNKSLPSNKSVTLFKFIKMAGDNLPSTLFVPFLTMLNGLSSSKETAKFCFDMLKQAGVHFPGTISWDHFFQCFSQYYIKLKHDSPAQMDTVYRIKPIHKSVNPEELEGLLAVLSLLRTIASQDDDLRATFSKHPNWASLPILLGLVSCHIPLTLKADILKTLSIFSKSLETAKEMWDNLEASQILVTVPTTSLYAPRGIETELDEVESKMGEYPLTKAILELLNTLISYGIPKILGAGTRKPGFDPYLSFILNSVFLKYNYRGYKTGLEKWDVARMCLKLFVTMLKQYDPQASDFPSTTRRDNLDSPPGYHLSVQLNNKSETLQAILDIIDEGIGFFETYVSMPFHGREMVEECTLLCLHILSRSLALQVKFFHILSTTSANIILTGVNKLLLSLNRKSGKPDHCLNIAEYVSYQLYLPNHSHCAVKIIRQLTSNVGLHSQLMVILSCSEKKQKIRNGFVQCLDVYHDDQQDITKTEILKLLKQCLPYKAPNLTHFLMGFDVEHGVSTTEFQYPGVMDFPRTCFHSILSILDTNISKASESVNEDLLESAYHFLYLLAANPKTSGPVLSFVRNDKQFFPLHLKNCRQPEDMNPTRLYQISWLLKTLAIELKVTSTLKQVSYIKELTTFLANMPATDENEKRDNFFLNQNLPFELKDLGGIPSPIGASPSGGTPKARKLHAYKMKKNVDALERARTSIIEYADAWKQVVGVLVSFVPIEILGLSDQQVFSTTILVNVLRKVTENELLPEVDRLLSGCVLLIMDNIKRHYLKDKKFVNVLSHNVGSPKKILESLIFWIMNSKASNVALRINIYAALVALLEFGSMQRDKEALGSDSFYLSPLDRLKHSFEPKGRLLNLHPKDFDHLGENLLEVISLDCIGGHEVCKILAMSSFTSLMSQTGNFIWLFFFSGRGYLKHIIQSIADSDLELLRHLDPATEDIKALYVYMGRILLLIRFAGNKYGSELILEHDLLAALSEMKVYERHPEVCKQFAVDDTVDDPLECLSEKYLQIFIPVLHICNAILTSLGTENQSAVIQILNFLIIRLDVVEFILRSGDTDLSLSHLKELSLLTFVIARTANNDFVNIIENPIFVADNKSQLYRIQRLMLNLIPKFILSEDTVRRLLANTNEIEGNKFQSSERLLHSMQIASNLLWYVHNCIANNDIEHGGVGALFHPSLPDPILHSSLHSKSTGGSFHNRSNRGLSEEKISLGWIIEHLIDTVTYQRRERATFHSIKRKIMEIPNMSSGELGEYIGDHMNLLDHQIKQERAHKVLREGLRKKTREMEHCAFIIENSVYIIWIHLHHFMEHATPRARHSLISNLDGTTSTSANLSLETSAENITSLKQRLVSVFSDSFSKQLLETNQGQSITDQEFLKVLIHQIKTLLQFA
ncbi:unnamed protein product [Ceutorhynchus assimilis]|uniref:Nuclear pore complex protein Nup205 n=1 Tax=Ceutorhynchus assimilis TaxID=467358 RepID=A0A9N9QIV0_9CUCU|nr:unnamed protein product [Ceutorhynchus assimilis]